jgi:hypothetical protein
MKCSGWFALRRAVAFLSCTIIVSCSQAPPEPAQEFTLPLSQVTRAPRSPEQATEMPTPSRLRYVAATWSSGRRHGPRPHCCEAEEDHSPPPASCSEESCFTCHSGQDTDRNRRTNLKAITLQASGYATMAGQNAAQLAPQESTAAE